MHPSFLHILMAKTLTRRQRGDVVGRQGRGDLDRARRDAHEPGVRQPHLDLLGLERRRGRQRGREDAATSLALAPLLLEGLELGDDDTRVGRFVLSDMVAACLQKLRKDDCAANRADVRDVRILAAVGAFLIAARLLNFCEVAVVGMLVAEGAARPRWVELFQAVVVKHPHLLHPAHVRLYQHLATLVPCAQPNSRRRV